MSGPLLHVDPRQHKHFGRGPGLHQHGRGFRRLTKWGPSGCKIGREELCKGQAVEMLIKQHDFMDGPTAWVHSTAQEDHILTSAACGSKASESNLAGGQACTSMAGLPDAEESWAT